MDEENKDLETPLSKMSPEQKEHLEKLQAIMQEKFEKRKFKANLKLREQRAVFTQIQLYAGISAELRFFMDINVGIIEL